MSSSELFIELDEFAFVYDLFFPFSEQPTEVSDVPLYNDTSAPPPCLSSSPPSMEMQGLSLRSSLVATQIPNGSSRTVLDHRMDASNFLGENSGSFDSTAFERIFSSHSLHTRPSFLLQPNFTSSMPEAPTLRIEAQNPSEHGGLGGPMRRACSTGDLQFNKMQLAYRSPNQHSHAMMNPSCIEETSSLRVGRYNPEERKQRIHRYIRKRTQRNFNKTIKYACRKTLADSRPRVRGRFARNDEIGDIPKAANDHAVDEDEDLWFDEIHNIVGRSSDGWNLDF